MSHFQPTDQKKIHPCRSELMARRKDQKNGGEVGIISGVNPYNLGILLPKMHIYKEFDGAFR